jgi:hypothetical protein
VSVLETVLLFVVAPVGGLLLIALATLVRPAKRGTRWRSGESWDHEPLWWMANPRGSGVAEPVVEPAGTGAATPHTARGGARGQW